MHFKNIASKNETTSYLNDNTHDRLEGHDKDRHRTFLCSYSHPVASKREDSILVLFPYGYTKRQ